MGISNAVGTILPYSRSPVNFVLGAGRSISIFGTAVDDVLISYGGGSILRGGIGDDTYYVWDQPEKIVEAANFGIDTVMSYGWQYTMPANVENMVVGSDRGYGIGNSLDNVIMGDVGSQIIDGAGGNDALGGGGGADTFQFSRGSGKDVIIDFRRGVDRVSFDATLSQFTNFATVKAAMTQSGADVLLNLGAGDSVMFRGRTIADFTATDFSLAPATATMRLTMADEFTTFNASATGYTANMSRTVWQTAYEFYSGYTTRTLAPGNPESQFLFRFLRRGKPVYQRPRHAGDHRRSGRGGHDSRRADLYVGHDHDTDLVQPVIWLFRNAGAVA